MLDRNLTRFVLGTEFELLDSRPFRDGHKWIVRKHRQAFEICTRCGERSDTRAGRCKALLRDEPLRSQGLWIELHKHRHFCKRCRKPFTETTSLSWPRRRTTYRLRKYVAKLCHDMTDLGRVRKRTGMSNGFIGETKTIRIFFYSMQLSGESGLAESTPVNDEIKRQFESIGAQQARQFIKMSATKAGQGVQAFALYFDSSKKMGFLNRNFVAGDVHVFVGAQSWNLRAATLRIISGAIYQQSTKMERSAPIGFTAGSFGTQRTCRELFTSTPQATQ